uniref:Uncharacterized protein n=1 Tax=uncultured prokaryote TaxID=198431 RepID=A0A0H5Q5I5_9ZZZZ|nr:hypothetical protein [uncultured prokaryote]
MPTTYEVTVSATNQGKPHINVFHVYDGNDNAVMADIAAYFTEELLSPLLPNLSAQFRYEQTRVQSLTAVNPGLFSVATSLQGTNIGEPMPTGTHVYVGLLSADPSFRSGGKLMGGQTETHYTDGEANVGILNFIQGVIDPFIANMNTEVGVNLAIYRPTLSLPGIPAVSIVSAALVRGGSVNNRRVLPFSR